MQVLVSGRVAGAFLSWIPYDTDYIALMRVTGALVSPVYGSKPNQLMKCMAQNRHRSGELFCLFFF